MRVVDGLSEEELLRLEREEQAVGTEERADEEQEEFVDHNAAAVRRYGTVVEAVATLMRRHSVDLDKMPDLTDDERQALSDLKEVIEGRRGGGTYFAEDRMKSLNRSLAVLQPVLALATMPDAKALQQSFNAVCDELAMLRERLVSREYAEEELYAYELERKRDEDDGDDDDDGDDGDDDEGDGDGEGDAAKGDAATGDAATGDAVKGDAVTSDAASSNAATSDADSPDGAPT